MEKEIDDLKKEIKDLKEKGISIDMSVKDRSNLCALVNQCATSSSSTSLTINGSTSGTLTLNTPAVVTTYTATFPAAQGTGALTNDGSGNLSWTPSTSASFSFANNNTSFFTGPGTNTFTTSTSAFTTTAGQTTYIDINLETLMNNGGDISGISAQIMIDGTPTNVGSWDFKNGQDTGARRLTHYQYSASLAAGAHTVGFQLPSVAFAGAGSGGQITSVNYLIISV